MARISAVLIAFNEEKRIETCLRSLSWAGEIILVDGGSTDRTVEIAKRYTDRIYKRNLDNFSNQKNYGIEKGSGKWIFSIDADEAVSPELQSSMLRATQTETEYDGYYVKRTNFIFGRRLRFAGQGSEQVLRFFRKAKGQFEQPIHERIKVDGKVGTLSGELRHESIASVEEYLKKLSRYTELEAQWMAERGVRPRRSDLGVRPMMRFLNYYFLRLGFLDGYAGFLYHSFSSFYYFFKHARLKEIEGTI